MGKFGIGARVRDRDGDLAEVIGKPAKGYRDVRILGGKYDGMTIQLPKSELEVAESGWSVEAGTITGTGGEIDFRAATMKLVSDEPKFKVGQRVVCIDNDGAPNDYAVGSVYAVQSIDADDDDTADEWLVYCEPGAGMFGYRFSPFTLEAGKFYRTRDGRKVGPMREGAGVFLEYSRKGQTAAFNGEGFGSYTADGIWLTSSGDQDEDIVAEWVEPAAAETIVVEDATDPWDPQVGDRIVLVKDGLSTTGAVGMHGVIRAIRPESTHTHQIELDAGGTYASLAIEASYRWTWATIDCLAPEPVSKSKFKVGDRVDLIRDGEPVEKWSNMTITSIDHSEFLYPISTDVGLPCFESELRLSQPQIPTLSVDDEVTLSAPARISGFDKKNAHVVLDTGGSFVLPTASLRLAA